MAPLFGRCTAALLLLGAVAACETPIEPPPAVSAVAVTPGPAVLASGGTLQLAAVVTASGGAVLEGREVAWTTDNSLVATVSPTGLLTGLLNTGGINRTTNVRATSEGKVGSASVQVQPAVAASLVLTPIVSAVTEIQSPVVQAVIRDAFNNILTGRLLTWESRDTSVATITGDGQLLPKAFIDTSLRTVRIVASIGGLRDSIVVAIMPSTVQTLTLLPAAPFLRDGWTKTLRLRAVTQGGAVIDGLLGSYTSSNPSVASVSAQGVLTAPAAASGTTQVIATYGSMADTATVTVDACGAASSGSYPIELRVVGAALSPSVQQAFDCAVARIRAVIRAPISTVVFSGGESAGSNCLGQTMSAGSTNGLIIFVSVVAIDGPGGVLGSAGPCLVRGTTRLPVVGAMQFDVADVANLEAAGTMGAVIMHEMLHVIGIGTTWRDPAIPFVVYTGDIGDPGFLGPRALTACRTEHGGTSTCATQVPIEDSFGVGTQFGHWRENIFVTELMTGFLTGTKPPFSHMTIEALGDMGYNVDPYQSNDYVLPNPPLMALMAAPGARGLKLPAPILPTHTVDANGRMRRILR